MSAEVWSWLSGSGRACSLLVVTEAGGLEQALAPSSAPVDTASAGSMGEDYLYDLRAQVAVAGGPSELSAAVGRGFPLPPARERGLLVGLDGVGEELHRRSPSAGAAFLAVPAGDLVGHLSEVVGQVSVAELGAAQVPPVLLGRREPLALQGAVPAPEDARSEGGAGEVGGDLLAEAQQDVEVDVPAVVAVGDLDGAGPAEQAAEPFAVLLPRGAGRDALPGVRQDVPAALLGLEGVEFDGVGLGLVLVDVPAVGLGDLDVGQALFERVPAGPLLGGEAEAVAAVVAHRQRQQERRPAELVDRAHHRREVVGPTGGDLRGAHRAAPHRPAGLQPAVRGGAGAVAVLDHPEGHARLGAHGVPAVPDALELRDAAELGPALPSVRPTLLGAGDLLRRPWLGVLAAASLPGPGAGSKSCCPFTENPRAHRAPPAAEAVGAGAGAPGPGPCGPGPSALLSSTRAAGPPAGRATRRRQRRAAPRRPR